MWCESEGVNSSTHLPRRPLEQSGRQARGVSTLPVKNEEAAPLHTDAHPPVSPPE